MSMNPRIIQVVQPGAARRPSSRLPWPDRILAGWGVPLSGPMDSFAFRLANLLVGNQPTAAALEMQFTGAELRFSSDAVIGLTGGDWSPTFSTA